METQPSQPALLVNSDPEFTPLLRVCSLLNEADVKYLVVGGYACILHGWIRATTDVDILVEDNEENFQAIIRSLSQLEDGAASELTPDDFRKNLVVKIADEVEVDVSRQAWTVTYAEAKPTAQATAVKGIQIPFVSLPMLIQSKSTHREQDQLDASQLQRLADQKDNN